MLCHPVFQREHTYRVTIQLVQNLPLTSKQKFRFGLPWPGQAKAELLFKSQQEVLRMLDGHPVCKYGIRSTFINRRGPIQLEKNPHENPHGNPHESQI